MKPILTALALGLSLTLGLPAWADTQHASHVGSADPAAMLTDGVVKKVDKAQGKLTLKHGPLENLEMPGMTMVFAFRTPVGSTRSNPATASVFSLTG